MESRDLFVAKRLSKQGHFIHPAGEEGVGVTMWVMVRGRWGLFRSPAPRQAVLSRRWRLPRAVR